MSLETCSFYISIIACGGAILSALYARWSAKHAERANEIALHNERLKIYRGFLDFKFELKQRPTDFSITSLVDFENHVRLAEFYFDSGLYRLLKQFSEIAVQIYAKRDCHKSTHGNHVNQERSGSDVLLNQIHSLSEQCQNLLPIIDEEFRKRLRLTTSS